MTKAPIRTENSTTQNLFCIRLCQRIDGATSFPIFFQIQLGDNTFVIELQAKIVSFYGRKFSITATR